MPEPCTKCGDSDAPKHRRRANGKMGYAKYCVLCHREDLRNWYHLRMQKKSIREKKNKQHRVQRKGNPKYLKIRKRHYYKHQDEILEKKRSKYVPKKRSPGKRIGKLSLHSVKRRTKYNKTQEHPWKEYKNRKE